MPCILILQLRTDVVQADKSSLYSFIADLGYSASCQGGGGVWGEGRRKMLSQKEPSLSYSIPLSIS